MIFVAASPMMIKLMMTACWVRLSAKNSFSPKPSAKVATGQWRFKNHPFPQRAPQQ